MPKHKDIVSYYLQTRKEKALKKTKEVRDPDREKEIITMRILDEQSTFWDIIDTLKEFSIAVKENELFEDYNYSFKGLSGTEMQAESKVLKRKVKKVSMH